ncbi:MAG: sel1 repeat family protein [Parachlamydiaceae bacterium]|nr:sel1 repeat family protein [Parachlamydiaceae bacterium]
MNISKFSDLESILQNLAENPKKRLLITKDRQYKVDVAKFFSPDKRVGIDTIIEKMAEFFKNEEITPEQKKKVLDNLRTIIDSRKESHGWFSRGASARTKKAADYWLHFTEQLRLENPTPAASSTKIPSTSSVQASQPTKSIKYSKEQRLELKFKIAQACMKKGFNDNCTIKDDKLADEAIEMYKQAAEGGHAQAQFELGYLFEHGIHLYKNSDKAIEWYSKAADQNLIRAQVKLGELYISKYYKGNNTDVRHLFSNLKFSNVLKWLKYAANKGDGDALGLYGILKSIGYYFYDPMCDVLLEKACAKKSSWGYLGKGLCTPNKKHYQNNEVDPDLEKAAALGNRSAQNKIIEGEESPNKIIRERALLWKNEFNKEYQPTTNPEKMYKTEFTPVGIDFPLSIEAKQLLADYYYDKKDYEKALKLFNEISESSKSAPLIKADALYYLALIYSEKPELNTEKINIKDLLIEADRLNPKHSKAQYELGKIAEGGLRSPYSDKKTQDDIDVIKWYTKAANGGLAVAQIKLAIICFVKKDREEAKKWAQLAEKQDNGDASGILCILNLNYKICSPKQWKKNLDVAKKYYPKSIEKNSPWGEYAKALYSIQYEQHVDHTFNSTENIVTRRMDRNLDAYIKAAEIGNIRAMLRISKHYASKGDAVNIEKAKGWLLKAAKLGNREAYNALLVDKDPSTIYQLKRIFDELGYSEDIRIKELLKSWNITKEEYEKVLKDYSQTQVDKQETPSKETPKPLDPVFSESSTVKEKSAVLESEIEKPSKAQYDPLYPNLTETSTVTAKSAKLEEVLTKTKTEVPTRALDEPVVPTIDPSIEAAKNAIEYNKKMGKEYYQIGLDHESGKQFEDAAHWYKEAYNKYKNPEAGLRLCYLYITKIPSYSFSAQEILSALTKNNDIHICLKARALQFKLGLPEVEGYIDHETLKHLTSYIEKKPAFIFFQDVIKRSHSDTELKKTIQLVKKEFGFDIETYIERFYKEGTYIENYTHEAVKWYEKKEKDEHAFASYYLGIMHENSYGELTENPFTGLQKSIGYYKIAIDKGVPKAKEALAIAQKKLDDFTAQMHLILNEPSAPSEVAEEIESHAQNTIIAEKLLEHDAYAGDINAQLRLGNKLIVKEKTKNEGLQLLEKAASQDDPKAKAAQYRLGHIYMNGSYGIPRDIRKATELFEKCNTDELPVALELAIINKELGNKKEVQKWLIEASKQDPKLSETNPDVIFELAQIQEGEGKIDEAISLYQKAFDLGNIQAAVNLGAIYATKKDLDKAIVFYKKAAENDIGEVYCKLVTMYTLKGDESEKLIWLEKAALWGHSRSQYELGMILDKQGNNSNSIKWMKKAVSKGYSKAQLYLYKKYIQEKDQTKRKAAIALLIKAANKNNVEAQYLLANNFMNGFQVKRDYLEAKKLLEKILEQKNVKSKESIISESEYLLGMILLDGLGVTANGKKAFELFESAAKSGNENARKILEELK